MNANRHASHRFLGSDLAAVAGHIIQPEEYEELPELTEDMLARGTGNRVWPDTVRTDPGHGASATEDATVKAGHIPTS